MKDSSSALGQSVRSPRLQTLAAVELPRNRRSDEVLHADVVLAGANSQPLDQRARQLRGQRVDWFVSFDTRARHSARIRLLADGSFTRTQTARRIPAYLYAPPAKNEFGGGDTVKCSGVAMLHTTPTQAAVDDLEQRGPGAGTIGAGLGIATLLAVVYVGRAEVLMMSALGMIAVTAAGNTAFHNSITTQPANPIKAIMPIGISMYFPFRINSLFMSVVLIVYKISIERIEPFA